MFVSKTITIDVKYLVAIEKAIEEGKIQNTSQFFQKAVQNELKKMAVSL